jgi:hypothetical protein
MYPHSDCSGVAGLLSRDVELAKAAVLYADQVDLISPFATMTQQLATMRDAGPGAPLSLLFDLDDSTLSDLGLDQELLTTEVRTMLPVIVQAMENDAVRGLLPPDAQDAFASFQEPLAEFRKALDDIDSATGASELRHAMSAGILRVVDLQRSANLVAASVDQAAGQDDPRGALSALISAWVTTVQGLLSDPARRVILDPEAFDLIRSLIDEGLVSIPPELAERSRAAHLGSGFIGRLPAFPEAPFDELLDLRRELAGPLARYRAATVRMSKALTASPFDQAITAEADDLWVEQVAPALVDLEDAYTDHGLVREIARRARGDARTLVLEGSGLLIGLQQFGHLSSALSGAAAAGGLAAQVVGTAWNEREASESASSRAEMYYLYRLGGVGA